MTIFRGNDRVLLDVLLVYDWNGITFQHPSHHDAELPSNPWYVVHAGARDTDAESGRKRPRPNPPIALEAGRRTTFPVNNPTNMSKIVRTELVIEQTRKEGKR